MLVIRPCYVLVTLSVLSCFPTLATAETRLAEGTLNANSSKEASRKIDRGELLLVSISPATQIQLEVMDPNGQRVSGLSFEHQNETKKFAFRADTTGAHRIVVRTKDEPAKYQISLDSIASDQSTEAKLSKMLAHWHSAEDPGGVVVITRNGERLLTKAFGSADVEQRVDVTENTVFDTASLAKHVTGLVIAKLVREEKMTLFDDIRKHVSEVPDFGHKITVRHLLHHTSGLRDFPGLMMLGDWHEHDVITLEQVLRLVSQQEELNFLPGSEYTYSNTGYSLLAEAISRVTGMTFDEWAQQNLFKPLGMHNTVFLTDLRMIVPHRANGYSLTEPGKMVREPSNLAAMGSSSFLTTASDMALWMANFDSENPEVHDLHAYRGTTNDGQDVGYGLGLGHGEHRGLSKVEHGGSSAGFRSHMLRFPDERLSIAVFSNQANFDPASLAYFAGELILDDEMEPKAPAAPQPKESAISKDVPIEILDRYVGSYEIQPGEVIQISREDTQLTIRPKGHPEAPPIIANPLSQTRFTGPPDGSIEFVPDDKGIVTKALIRHQEQVLFHAKKLEEPVEKVDFSEYAGRYLSDELESSMELTVSDTGLVARQLKRVRQLTWISADHFGTDDGMNFHFQRSDEKVHEFRATTGPRVRNVRFKRVEN